MYKSGLLMSSRGGCQPSFCPVTSDRRTCRAHGLCRHGNSTSRSFCSTYAFETLYWFLSLETGRYADTYIRESFRSLSSGSFTFIE